MACAARKGSRVCVIAVLEKALHPAFALRIAMPERPTGASFPGRRREICREKPHMREPQAQIGILGHVPGIPSRKAPRQGRNPEMVGPSPPRAGSRQPQSQENRD